MSLATRCTACGTIFRVVQDQLKVSEGWVRCGRCDEVFNALEGLFDLGVDSPPQWTPERAAAAATASGRSSDEGVPVPVQEANVADLLEEDRIASRFFQPHQDDVDHSPAEAVAERDRVDFADAQFDADLLAEANSAEPPEPAPPEFVVRAEQEARWQRPVPRLLLGTSIVLLCMAMGLQLLHRYRDVAAARSPLLAPMLEAWCGFAGCRIEPPRRIDDVMVDNTGLTRAAPGTDTFRLSITLRNRGDAAVAMPAIDLSLTDASGALVSRKALMPADFRTAQNSIPPGGEAPLQLLIATGNPQVSGYTVEVFYP